MALTSCRTCPSYTTEDAEQRKLFGKSVGAPMCGRYGYVLGRPGLDNEQMAIHVASDCDSHGEPQPTDRSGKDVPVKIIPKVTRPDVDILAKGETGTPCKTCTGCENLLTSDATLRDFGWPVSICKAKGMAVFKPLREAKGCPYASPGAPTDDSSGLEILPEFLHGFAVDDELVLSSVLPEGVGVALEPSTQPTEGPVSDEDLGTIRAWFKVKNPVTGTEYFLPIFERDFFSEEEQELIPQTGDEEHPELYVDHNDLLATFAIETYTLDESLCLVGQPGNGKTEFGRYLAWRMQVPFRRLSITENTDPEEFLGSPQYDPERGTFFKPGRLPQAWVRPGVLVSDEYNIGPDAIQQAYRPLTDNSKQLVIEDFIYPRNDYCFHLLTMNPAWDMRNVGTKPMADADGNRLSFAWVPEPPAAIMRHIIKSRCVVDGYDISDETLSLISKIGKDIREFSEQGTFPGSWGIRQEVKVARKTAHYDLVTAYRRAILDNVDPEVAKLVVMAIESHMDGKGSS